MDCSMCGSGMDDPISTLETKRGENRQLCRVCTRNVHRFILEGLPKAEGMAGIARVE